MKTLRPAPNLRAGRSVTCALTAALASLPGCFSGLHGQAAPPQRYVLEPPQLAPDSPAVPAAAASLRVLAPIAAPGLAGDGIAVVRSGERLDDYANVRWAAAAPAALQSLVIRTIRSTARFAAVEGDVGAVAAGYLLSLDLTHFEARYAEDGPPTVRVEITVELARSSDRAPLRGFVAHSEVKAQADRMQAVIAAFQAATQDVLQQIAAGVQPPQP